MKQTFIFLDFETVPKNENFQELQMPSIDEMKTGNAKDLDVIKKIKEEKYKKTLEEFNLVSADFKAKQVKERSLNPLQNKIICAGIAINKEDPFCITGTEEHIFSELNKIFSKARGHYRCVTYNGKNFDFNILALRTFKFNLSALKPQFVEFARFDEKWIDLAEKIKFFGHTYFSFKDVCEYFNIESPKSDLDGSRVYEAYCNGEIERIAKYCCKDVKALRDLFIILSDQFKEDPELKLYE